MVRYCCGVSRGKNTSHFETPPRGFGYQTKRGISSEQALLDLSGWLADSQSGRVFFSTPMRSDESPYDLERGLARAEW